MNGEYLKCSRCGWPNDTWDSDVCSRCEAQQGKVRRVGIVGSRNFPDLWMVSAFVSTLPLGAVVVSGGAQGVDTMAAAAALDRNLEVEIHRPVWKLPNGTTDRGAGFKRNKTIVDRSTELWAFIYNRSKGTLNTMEWAKRLGKPLTVVAVEEK